jgi:hypothetical protein
MWFDTRMDADESRIRELENGFRRDGLPNLIVDLSASEDIFTRAIPFLTLVFVVEIVNTLAILVDSAHRDQFVDSLSAELRDTVPAPVGVPGSARPARRRACAGGANPRVDGPAVRIQDRPRRSRPIACRGVVRHALGGCRVVISTARRARPRAAEAAGCRARWNDPRRRVAADQPR